MHGPLSEQRLRNLFPAPSPAAPVSGRVVIRVANEDARVVVGTAPTRDTDTRARYSVAMSYRAEGAPALLRRAMARASARRVDLRAVESPREEEPTHRCAVPVSEPEAHPISRPRAFFLCIARRLAGCLRSRLRSS